MDNDEPLLSRLTRAQLVVKEVQEICGVPSLSWGILHHGQVIKRQSIGYRDVEGQLPANPDTMYMIGSLSKSFLSAAVGKLVDGGALSWLDPIQKYIPEFNPKDDPNIGPKADIIDALRHSTGLAAPTLLSLGPRATILSDEKDFIRLLNSLPTSNQEGQRFNRWWMYNNYTYGLIAKVVEIVSGQSYADYIQEHILTPLGMHHTAISSNGTRKNDNIAYPYVCPSVGEYYKIPSESWPCDDHTPLLAAMGMRSSVNDMLVWSKAVLEAEKQEETGQEHDKAISKGYPLKQMRKIRQAYWTRPVDDSFQNETAYCMGWLRVEMPSSSIGMLSCNTDTRKRKEHLKYILGTQSGPMVTICHNGVVNGSTAALYTFPETQSAVVVLSNGLHSGDASDFVAQILIQALFDLQPNVDLLPLVRMEAEIPRQWYESKFAAPWRQDRRLADKERNRELYLGDYYGFDDTFVLSIVPRPIARSNEKEPEPDLSLAVVFNRRTASICDLEFYRKDTYSFFPQSHEDHLLTMYPLWCDYRMTILEFCEDESGEVTTIRWLWDEDEEPAILIRKHS
ncbi:serine hydrolase domain-containing protein [Aspergillus alliaceus]|uniref:serine hydrolase domain-containing protein n=1 Tax=Petromyces alliaceus TaxID=209559 RepID=UPI0012A60833|nr:beta-lactamase/transpeptidase-like protein [Aspergillus alliaceus]KAB8235162.1 beta-lactamase/transpeptidase-like protein [Aspergillus alliaceus]